MRDIGTKTTDISVLTAEEYNSTQVENENAVLRAGISLDSEAGPDNDLFMLAKSIQRHAVAAQSYQDSGSANTFVLSSVQPYEQPSQYFDGMTVTFKAGSTNTGRCTINLNSIGAVSFTQANGSAFTSGQIGFGQIITARFFQSNNRFESVTNTTPPLVGPSAPDQIAVYSDTGTPSGIQLTIEPGYTRPGTFTDQMVVLFKANATNNGIGSHEVAIDGLSSRDVVETDNSNPVAGRISAGDWIMLVFREVRNKFEIAFASERPVSDSVVAAVVTSSSGIVYNVAPVDQNRAPASYTNGMIVTFKADRTNTGAVSLNFNGLGPRSLRRGQGGGALVAREISNNAEVSAQFDSSANQFRIVSNSTYRGRILHTDLAAGQRISAAGETVLNFATPSRDDQGLYDNVTDSFVIPAGRGITSISISVRFSAQLPSSGGYGIQIRRNRNGSNVNVVGAQSFAGNTHPDASLNAIAVQVQDGDRFFMVSDTTTSTNLTRLSGTASVRIDSFVGE